MRNFKKIFSIALTLSIVICFAGCQKAPVEETPPSSVTNADENVAGETAPYKIVQTNNNSQSGYTYFLYDNNGNVVYEETVAKEPVIEYVTDNILEIRDSHGSSADLCRYFDLTTYALSDCWYNTFYTDGSIAVHMGYDEKRDPDTFIVVRNIFDREKLYKEISWEFPPVLTPSDAIKSVKYFDSDTLEIVYLEGEQEIETTAKIDLK